MYYDPMISKLVTWGETRKEAMDLIGKAMDEYVIRGVIHNLGFGRSIVNNPSFAGGSYSTAFIPTFYPTGFKGDKLESEDFNQLMVAAHYIRNQQAQYALL
jgi:propionyl-CoA carboxylase alpha chain